MKTCQLICFLVHIASTVTPVAFVVGRFFGNGFVNAVSHISKNHDTDNNHYNLLHFFDSMDKSYLSVFIYV